MPPKERPAGPPSREMCWFSNLNLDNVQTKLEHSEWNGILLCLLLTRVAHGTFAPHRWSSMGREIKVSFACHGQTVEGTNSRPEGGTIAIVSAESLTADAATTLNERVRHKFAGSAST